MAEQRDRRAPMASAPFRYRADGTVDWGNMWDSFCALALDGGPPHRATLLEPGAAAPAAAYAAVEAEIIRGIGAVSGLAAAGAEPGWIAIACASEEQAAWLRGAIEAEGVAARAVGASLWVPTGADYTIRDEIKNVITAVAKTTHYWREHLPPQVRQALRWMARLRRWGRQLRPGT